GKTQLPYRGIADPTLPVLARKNLQRWHNVLLLCDWFLATWFGHVASQPPHHLARRQRNMVAEAGLQPRLWAACVYRACTMTRDIPVAGAEVGASVLRHPSQQFSPCGPLAASWSTGIQDPFASKYEELVRQRVADTGAWIRHRNRVAVCNV